MSASNRLSTVFAAGALGGLANAVTIWFFGSMGWTKALGVSIAPALSPSFMYSKIVWGGIWGALFLLPILKSQVVARGVVFSFVPTIVQLIYIFPHKTSAGMYGMGLGKLTFLFVILFNMVWGIVASYWAKTAR